MVKSQIGYGISQILVINRVRVLGNGPHDPHPIFLVVRPPRDSRPEWRCYVTTVQDRLAPRLDFRRILQSGLYVPPRRGLLSRTAAGNRAYVAPVVKMTGYWPRFGPPSWSINTQKILANVQLFRPHASAATTLIPRRSVF